MPDGPAKSKSELVAELQFQSDIGADEALSEAPIDRFVEASKNRVTPHPSAQSDGAPSDHPGPAQRRTGSGETLATSAPSDKRPVDPEEGLVAARDSATSAVSLEALREAMDRFDHCPLKAGARNLVFGDGSPTARLMFVGEAPGREEDRTGLPFVGRSGQLLDLMLKAIGLPRSEVYIANTIPWRPPGNRTPTPIETEMCRPFIERQITLVDPDVLVLLGGAAAKQLLDTSEGILRLRGKWRTYQSGKKDIRALATLHPAYLLRDPAQKRLAWRDFLVLKEALSDPV